MGGPEPAARHPGRRLALTAGILVLLAAGLLAGCWKWQGERGLAGSAAGLGIGGGIALVAHLLRGRARTVQGPRLVQAVMLSVFTSFVLFAAAVVLVGLLWREAVAPTVLSALGLYLGASILDASLEM